MRRGGTMKLTCPFGGADGCEETLEVLVAPSEHGVWSIDDVSGCAHVDGQYDSETLYEAVEAAMAEAGA